MRVYSYLVPFHAFIASPDPTNACHVSTIASSGGFVPPVSRVLRGAMADIAKMHGRGGSGEGEENNCHNSIAARTTPPSPLQALVESLDRSVGAATAATAAAAAVRVPLRGIGLLIAALFPAFSLARSLSSSLRVCWWSGKASTPPRSALAAARAAVWRRPCHPFPRGDVSDTHTWETSCAGRTPSAPASTRSTRSCVAVCLLSCV